MHTDTYKHTHTSTKNMLIVLQRGCITNGRLPSTLTLGEGTGVNLLLINTNTQWHKTPAYAQTLAHTHTDAHTKVKKEKANSMVREIERRQRRALRFPEGKKSCLRRTCIHFCGGTFCGSNFCLWCHNETIPEHTAELDYCLLWSTKQKTASSFTIQLHNQFYFSSLQLTVLITYL